MAYAALTQEQLTNIRKELAIIIDPVMQGALLRIFDLLAGEDDADVTALEADVGALETSTTALQTSVTNLNAWATALATKLNADAGVTDTNYDTDPQA